jgi:hypothetical protein
MLMCTPDPVRHVVVLAIRGGRTGIIEALRHCDLVDKCTYRVGNNKDVMTYRHEFIAPRNFCDRSQGQWITIHPCDESEEAQIDWDNSMGQAQIHLQEQYDIFRFAEREGLYRGAIHMVYDQVTLAHMAQLKISDCGEWIASPPPIATWPHDDGTPADQAAVGAYKQRVRRLRPELAPRGDGAV